MYNAYTIKPFNNTKKTEISDLSLNESPLLIKYPHFLIEILIKRGEKFDSDAHRFPGTFVTFF